MAAATKTDFLDEDDDDILFVKSCRPSNKKVTSKWPGSKMGETQVKRPAQWVASSFECFDGFSDPPKFAKTKQSKLSKGSFSQSMSHASVMSQSTVSCDLHRNSQVTYGKYSQKRTVLSNEVLWSDKYSPQNKADLAVHPKKVTEVETWLQNYQRKIGRTCPLLLLTGPAGCGKTATLKALTTEMGLEIQEWINPATTGSGVNNREDWTVHAFRNQTFPDSESQVKIFQDFLLRANKYQTLQIFGGSTSSGKIILVEDFPNFFFKDPQSFHDVLQKYKHHGKCPLVFIVSDSASGQSNERILFPPNVQADLDIRNISFNPVAMTLLTRLLSRVAGSEATQHGKSTTFTKPTSAVLESIAMSCTGDIRGAVNALQFASLKGKGDIVKCPMKTTKGTAKNPQSQRGKGSSSRKKDTGLLEGKEGALGFRDSSLFLFRALGKVLYVKRDSEDTSFPGQPLPHHLSHHERAPLMVSAEEVIDRCHISGDFFNAYLHQNYMDFYSSVEDVERASQYFSDADFLTSEWSSKRALSTYASSIAARGLMHSNCAGPPSGPGRGWKPLHKPQLYTTSRKTRAASEVGKSLFQSQWSTPEVLFKELLPYISLINITLRNPRQISFLQEICRFSGIRGPDKLDDKEGSEIQDEDADPGILHTCVNSANTTAGIPPVSGVVSHSEDSCDTIISNSQSRVQVPAEDEEIVIEDFEDD